MKKYTINNNDYELKTSIDDINLYEYNLLINILKVKEQDLSRNDNLYTVNNELITENIKYLDRNSENFIISQYETILNVLSDIPIDIILELKNNIINPLTEQETNLLSYLINSIDFNNIISKDSYDILKNDRLFKINYGKIDYSFPTINTITFGEMVEIDTLLNLPLNIPYSRNTDDLKLFYDFLNINRDIKYKLDYSLLIGTSILINDINNIEVYLKEPLNANLTRNVEYEDYNQLKTLFKSPSKLLGNHNVKSGLVIYKNKNTYSFDNKSVLFRLSLVSELPAKDNIKLVQYINNELNALRGSFKFIYEGLDAPQSEPIGINMRKHFERFAFKDTFISLVSATNTPFNSVKGTYYGVKEALAIDVLDYLNVKKSKDNAEYSDYKLKSN